MTTVQKRVVILLSAAAILFLGILFWPFLYLQVFYPISNVLWVLLRIFILSIDQKIYWGGLIALIIVLGLRMVGKQTPQPENMVKNTYSNSTLKDIDYWREIFNLVDFEDNKSHLLKRELAQLLVIVYASKYGLRADFHLMDKFIYGQIELPYNIRNFLFLEDQVQQQNIFKKFLYFIKQAWQKGFFRSKKRQKEDLYQQVCEVITFLESSLENNNDT